MGNSVNLPKNIRINRCPDGEYVVEPGRGALFEGDRLNTAGLDSAVAQHLLQLEGAVRGSSLEGLFLVADRRGVLSCRRRRRRVVCGLLESHCEGYRDPGMRGWRRADAGRGEVCDAQASRMDWIPFGGCSRDYEYV